MKQSILLLTLFCFTVCNAQKVKKITGSGTIKTITRTTTEYDKIKVASSFSVKLVAGIEGNIKIEGDENIIQYITTEVKNNELIVGFEKGFYIKYDYPSTVEITIPFKKINALSFSGSGSLTTSDLIVTDNLDIESAGSGSVTFETSATSVKITRGGSGSIIAKGKATNLTVASTGSGNVNASQLTSANVTANQTGSGNIKVNCSNNLTVTSSGSGSVNYKGSPKKVEKNSSGSGSISGS
ncbi:head GIN domain-containing protein [Flavobacterium sp.]